ncbi:hypothetical protein EV715DRAFT_287524 [Schizophyllum commune]
MQQKDAEAAHWEGPVRSPGLDGGLNAVRSPRACAEERVPLPSDVVYVPLSRPLDAMLMRMGPMPFPLVRGF